MEIKDLKPGDKVRITSDVRELRYGHEDYANCVVTVREVRGRTNQIVIEEFNNNENVSLRWLPSDRIKEKISIEIPEELFEI